MSALLLTLATTGCASSGPHRQPARPRSWTVSRSTESLPLRLPVDGARSVITITARSARATMATAQAWVARSGGSWSRYGPEFTAHLGVRGLTASEHEGLAATPTGSFSLTEAFGRLPNPGTRLPYLQTTPRDWWISEPGPLYNTHQRCVSGCRFNTGQPNAQLFYVAPQYDLAVVIDYNRHPVVQGLGSGIFLHVTTGRPTNGCVSVPASDLVPVMRWLKPADRPRILIGVASP